MADCCICYKSRTKSSGTGYELLQKCLTETAARTLQLCRRSKCNTQGCLCRAHALQCTDLCGCGNCENGGLVSSSDADKSANDAVSTHDDDDDDSTEEDDNFVEEESDDSF